MFLVFSKEKICTYIVSILTVFLLFFVANTMKSDNFNAVATSSNAEKLLPIYNVQTQDKKISLTMNCAWNADDVDKVLEVLNQNNVKITFFMVGEWVDKYPEAVKKIYEAGHEIGSHSNTHPHVNNLTAEKNLEEIKLSVDKIEKITGYKTNLYRAPYGEYNNTVIKTAQQNGFYPIQWNLDTLDYQGLTGEEMWNRLKNKLDGGAIILSHNGTKHTADSLDMLIKNIKASGFQVTTISEIIYKDNYSINNKGTQIKN